MTLLVVTIITPIVPAVALVLFARSRARTRLEWFLNFITTASVIEIVHVLGAWVFISYYLRYLFVAAFLVVAFMQFGRLRAIGRGGNELSPRTARPRGRLLARIISTVVVLWLAVLVVRGHSPPAGAVDIAVPFQEGRYCIIQGGSNYATNPFHHFVDSEYSLDIVKMNRAGNRARTLFPRRKTDYAIFGEMVYSPLDGTVVTAVDSIADNDPPRANAMAPLGNHVVIEGEGVRVILAHLKRGDLVVSRGDPVLRGDPLGRVGNSGYSNEPHLHLQAIRPTRPGAALPVPMTLEGRFVAANDIVTVR